MASTEIWVTSVLSIIFSVVAAYIAIAFLLPMVRALVKEVIEENNAVAGFMSILVIVIYILLFKNVIRILTSESLNAGAEGGKSALSYLIVLDPGIAILDQLLPYIGWVLLGALIAFGLRHYFKK
ncbi:hypothetical protein HYV89_02935 [Candidatus Woesearchaeota archaeon]|nr:hypothetical protein [Candidatus Woesearchaeota archaeon]